MFYPVKIPTDSKKALICHERVLPFANDWIHMAEENQATGDESKLNSRGEEQEDMGKREKSKQKWRNNHKRLINNPKISNKYAH